jgi:hypothetical protein
MHTRGQDDSERNLLGAKLKKWKKKLNPNLTPGQGAKVQKSTWHVG